MLRLIQKRYIPTNNVYTVKHKTLPLVMYLYTNTFNKFCFILYRGKSTKPICHYSYRSEEKRNEAAQSAFKANASAMIERDERIKANRTQKHTLKEGDILYTSWGYDQTNVNFYQVTKVLSDYFVEIREIAARSENDDFMSGRCVATTDAFCGHAMRKRAKKTSVYIDKVCNAYLWDGSPKYHSSYH